MYYIAPYCFKNRAKIVQKTMVKVSIILDKRYLLKSGKYPVKIRIARNGSTFFIPTRYELNKEEWDDAAHKVVRRKDKTILNLNLSKRRESIEQEIENLQNKGLLRAFSNARLAEHLKDGKERNIQKLFITQFNDYVARANKARTKEIYQSTLRHIERYCNIDDLTIDDIDIDWLDRFCAYLSANGCKAVNTRAIHLRCIRAIINHAKKRGLVKDYAFDNYRINREETIKRALTLNEVRLLLHAELPAKQALYRDIFFLIIYLMGINLVDLSELKEINNGRIQYRREKTGTLYDIKVEKEALAIINKYKGQKHLLYVFDKYKNYNHFKRRLNENLKPICAALGIKGNVSSYWARHTVATLMYELGISMDVISDCLGHKSYHNSVTLVYVKKSKDKIDEANRKLIDYIWGK
jgi:site-specific recombinase XerD